MHVYLAAMLDVIVLVRRGVSFDAVFVGRDISVVLSTPKSSFLKMGSCGIGHGKGRPGMGFELGHCMPTHIQREGEGGSVVGKLG